MKIVVTGGSGQLAEAIRRFWTGHDLVFPPENILDLSSPGSIRSVMDAERPAVVINAGAFTQVDLCEAEIDRAMKVNGEAVGILAEKCTDLGALLVQVSTDYVFDGKGQRPYREDDPVNPMSEYGKSKLLGEREATRAKDHLILRTAWLYDAWGNNFYNTMLKLADQGKPLKVVDDQKGTPTTCRALARQMQKAVEEGWRGVVHATCAGETTWFGFASEIFRSHGMNVDLKPCTTQDFPRPAPRPSYSVLSGTHRRECGSDLMPDWRASLSEVVQETRK